MTWITDLLQRYRQDDNLRFRPYTPLDPTRQRYTPQEVRPPQRAPFDPSTYYNQYNLIKRQSQAATRVTQQQAVNTRLIELERQRQEELARRQEELATLQNMNRIDLSQLPAFITGVARQELGKPGQLSRPLSNYSVTSGYGVRNNPTGAGQRMHSGIDLAAPQGTPIYATHDGYISFAGGNGGYGNFVRIDGGGGISTTYAHQYQVNVKRGQYIKRGQVIGWVGSTGDSTGPHLHYEVLINGRAVNPAGYL